MKYQMNFDAVSLVGSKERIIDRLSLGRKQEKRRGRDYATRVHDIAVLELFAKEML